MQAEQASSYNIYGQQYGGRHCLEEMSKQESSER